MILETFKLTCKSCQQTWFWEPFIYKVAPKCPNKCQDKKGSPIHLSFVSFDPVKITETKEITIVHKDEMGNGNLTILR
jgi:hypothetical protein